MKKLLESGYRCTFVFFLMVLAFAGMVAQAQTIPVELTSEMCELVNFGCFFGAFIIFAFDFLGEFTVYADVTYKKISEDIRKRRK